MTKEMLRQIVEPFDGLFLGALSPDEESAVRDAVKANVAKITYEGGCGFMGLGKVRVLREGYFDGR